MSNFIGGYDLSALIILIVLDLILGYIKALLIEKNFKAGYAIRGLIVKSSVIIGASFIDFIVNLANHLDVYSKELQNFIGIAFNGIIILACVSELISVLANLSLITGIDFNNIPGVKNNILEKEKENDKNGTT